MPPSNIHTYTDTQNSLVNTEFSPVTTDDTSYLSAKKNITGPCKIFMVHDVDYCMSQQH